jgi:hypothetical protein
MGIKNALLIFLIRNHRFQALGQFAARKHHDSLTAHTLKTYIGPKAQHLPLMTATGMGFAQAHNIVHL